MPNITPQSVTDFMNTLQRFFKIGIYYPDGHKVADQAAASLLQSLQDIASEESPFIRFIISQTSFSIQAIALDITIPAVEHFHDLLYSLSISTLEFHRSITADEMRQFLSRLIFLRTQVQSSRFFQEIQITEIPSTVRVQQQRFLTDKSASSQDASGESSQPSIDFLLANLSLKGLSEQQISLCRELLESIPNTLQKRHVAAGDLPSVSWTDVENLLLHVAKDMQTENSKSAINGSYKSPNIDTLVALLKSLEETSGTLRSQQAVNLLVQTLKGAPAQTKEDTKKPAPPPQNDRPGVTFGELCLALTPLLDTQLPNNLSENNRCEELSILLQLLGQEKRHYAKTRTREVLHNCLRAPLETREWRVFVRGTQQLFDTDDIDSLEGHITIILDILHSHKHTSPLTLLTEICQGLTEKEFVVCWPFLVNEVFISGPKDNPELFKETTNIISLLPLEDMHRNIPRLERLTALREKQFAPALFAPPEQALKPLFNLLLKTSHAKYIYEQIIYGLKTSPLGWLDQAVAPLLDSTLPTHKQFILELLVQDDAQNPGKGLIRMGTEIIRESLEALPKERMSEQWVPFAIRATAKNTDTKIRSMLKSIAYSKHYLIIPNWPATARKAAKAVLKKQQS